MSVEIQNMVRADPSVTVSLLQNNKATVQLQCQVQTSMTRKEKITYYCFCEWKKSYNELSYWLSVVVHYNP